MIIIISIEFHYYEMNRNENIALVRIGRRRQSFSSQHPTWFSFICTYVALISLIIYYYFCSPNCNQKHVTHKRKIIVHLRCRLKTMLMVIAFTIHIPHIWILPKFKTADTSFIWEMEYYLFAFSCRHSHIYEFTKPWMLGAIFKCFHLVTLSFV